MKHVALLLVVFVFATNGTAQDIKPASTDVYNLYHSPANAHDITIESKDGIISSIHVPPGVLLNVEFSQESNPQHELERELSTRTFHGNVVIRLRHMDGVGPEERAAMQIMSKASSVLQLTDVSVVVKRLN